MKVAAIQLNSKASVNENLKTIEILVRQAVKNQASLILLPENVAFMGANEQDKLTVAENPKEGPIQTFFAKLAKELNVWLIGGTIPLKSPDKNRVYAASLVWDNQGKNVARYDKIHLFDVQVPITASKRESENKSESNSSSSSSDSKSISASKENNSIQTQTYAESKTIYPGEAIVSIESPAGKLGLSVCYDLRFPELYRKLFNEEVEIIVVPSAFTTVTGEAHWESLLRARAIENFSYVIAAAQFGVHANGRSTFGHSMIIDPWGKILAVLPEGEGIIYAEIDLEYLKDLRKRFPALQHRRIF